MLSILIALLIILGFSFGFSQQETESSEESGTLIVEVTGLSSGKEAEVWAVSKGSRQKFTLRPSTDKAGALQLSPDTYIISALNVSGEGGSYMVSDTRPSNVIEISTGETTTVSIEYSPVAALTIEVNNLPADVLSKLEVVNGSSGEKTSVCNLASSPMILPLLPSYYAIVAYNVSAGGNTYEAEQDVYTVTLKGGELTTISINYENVGETKEGDLEGVSSGC